MSTKATTCWDLAAAVIPHTPRVLLHGPPGTGKTTYALTAGLRPGQTAVAITLTEETPGAELRGMYVPEGRSFVWHDGPVMGAWRSAARLVINELDHGSGDVLSLLMALVDDPTTACLTLPTRETVRPAKGFTVIATMNGDPEGLPPALRDRFPVAIEIDTVHPDAVALLPADVRQAARATAVLPAERRVSVRSWTMFAELRAVIGSDGAARAVFGRRATDVLSALRLASA